MSEPLVTIVIATRERPAFLERAIRSILSQTLQEIEILVIDDGSSQPTLDAYKKGRETDGSRVAYHLAAEAPGLIRGISAARNHGLSLAQAPYVVFFDDDDEMTEPNHLETAVRFHREYPRCLYFGDIRSVDGDRVVSEARIRVVDKPMTQVQVCGDPPVYCATVEQFSRALAHRYPHFDAALLDTGLAREIGGFTAQLFLGEDINFFLRYADRCSGVIYRREAVVDFDVAPRPRAFNVLPPIERDLMASMSFSQARIHLQSPYMLRAATAIEAYMLARVAGDLRAIGARSAARLLARQSLALRLTRNGLRQFVWSFLR